MDSKKKNILLGVLVVGIVSMSVAFAALTTRLSLNGTANVAATRWNIHFQNWNKVSIPTAGGHTNTATSPAVEQLTMSDENNVTKVDNINVTLNQPGDTAKYTFEIINEGTIDAKLSNFTATNTTNNELVDYDVKCFESSTREGTQVTQNSVLEANGDIAYCYVQVTYKDQTNSHTAGENQVYNQSAVTTNLSANWIWVQDDGNDSAPPTGWQPTYGEGTAFRPSYFAYASPTSSDIAEPAQDVFAGLDTSGNKGVCIKLNGEVHCFQVNNGAFEQEHLKGVFGENACKYISDRGRWECITSDFYCDVYNTGFVYCGTRTGNTGCRAYENGIIECD